MSSSTSFWSFFKRYGKFSIFNRLSLFILVVLICFPLIVNSHSHSHDVPPSFKYSKEANEALKHKDTIKEPIKEPIHRDKQNLWIEALGSTLLISIAPFFILFLVPLDNRSEQEPLLKVLLSFASGGLLGDAFLHLIPHALSAQSHDHAHSQNTGEHSHSHSHSHSHEGHDHGPHMKVGLWVLIGILLFLFVEKFVRLLNPSHSHIHIANNDNKKDGESSKKKEKKNDNLTDTKKTDNENSSNDAKKSDETSSEPIKVAAYLNLAADITHNFTDGLAIGASYLAGRNVGIVTTITILLHEVPHEIGDFAILVQSGCSKKKAMYLQLLTALGAFSGTLVSLIAEGVDEAATAWVLPLTAGGFIYIATVSVLPDLLEDSKLIQSIKEVIALILGVSMMVFIANFE